MSSAAPADERPATVIFAEAERVYDRVEEGASIGAGVEMESIVREGLRLFDACDRRARTEALFSSNEEMDDVATEHVPLLLVDFCRARLHTMLMPEVGPRRGWEAASRLPRGCLPTLPRPPHSANATSQ